MYISLHTLPTLFVNFSRLSHWRGSSVVNLDSILYQCFMSDALYHTHAVSLVMSNLSLLVCGMLTNKMYWLIGNSRGMYSPQPVPTIPTKHCTNKNRCTNQTLYKPKFRNLVCS